MRRVEVIQAQKEKIDRNTGKTLNKLRVAAYCKVSTDSDEQMNSYQAQVNHYIDLIKKNKEWEFVEIYADSGISGTQSDNRDEFQRMISDANDGLIDIIITKSISRFARNTMDTLKYVKMLKDENIAIIFEKENINILTMNGEMLLTIISSLAQQESESLSANTKMGLKMKMKTGELVGQASCLGYDYDKEKKKLIMNEEEAKIVKYIFNRYTSGIGCFVLEREQINKAKEILEKRSRNHNQGRMKKHSLKYAFSIMMKCAYCGGNIIRRRWHSGIDKQKVVWFCTTAIRKGKKSCPECKAVEEKIIENAFVRAFNILCTDNKTIVEEFLENIEKELQSKDNKKLLKQIDGDIRNVENKISKLLDLHLEDQIDKENYEEKYTELKKELQELKTEKRELGIVEDEEKTIKERIVSFRKLFQSKEPLVEFDKEVFKTVVEEVIIGGYKEDGSIDPYMLTFIFKTGLTSKIDGHKRISKSEQKCRFTKMHLSRGQPMLRV